MKTVMSGVLTLLMLAGVAAQSGAQAADPNYGSRRAICDHGDC